MSRLIDANLCYREVARERYATPCDELEEEHNSLVDVILADIRRQPTVDAVEVEAVHAEWIIDEKVRYKIWQCHCNKCNQDPLNFVGGSENWWTMRLPKFCPNCGARMDGERREEQSE